MRSRALAADFIQFARNTLTRIVHRTYLGGGRGGALAPAPPARTLKG
ncbi:hypothetical protein P3T23_008748 [Paraburkholderia sp. GAS448]